MTALLVLFLATAFPSTSKTSWMRPEAFHLTIGMTRKEAMSTLKSSGWKARKADDRKQVILDYADDKTITLTFVGDRLRSIRFELFTILHDAHGAFDEEMAYLRTARGEPRKNSKSVALYDDALPNVMVVLANDPKSEQGQKGVGMVVVRYYDPR